MLITNKTNLHIGLALWMLDDSYDYDNRATAISTTRLLKPVKQVIMSGRVDKEVLELDVLDFANSKQGSAIHDALERLWLDRDTVVRLLKRLGYADSILNRIKVNPTKDELTPETIPVYVENRCEREINGMIVTGKYDLTIDHQITDYKSTGTYTFIKIKDNLDKYTKQLSIYRWLNQDKVKKDIGIINFVFVDWKKGTAKLEKEKGYPQHRALSYPVKLMSISDTEAYVRKQIQTIKSLQHDPEENLPPCTKEDLWQGDTVYKYYKNPEKRSRSTKNFSFRAEAQERLIKDGSVGVIVEVLGRVRFCEYCDGLPICKQAAQYLQEGSLIID